MKVKYLVFNYLLSYMFRQYVESHHQIFLNNCLKVIKDIKRIIQNNIGTEINVLTTTHNTLTTRI